MRLSEKLADLFWIFGKVVLDVAETERAEDRFFRFALEEEFEGCFDEPFGRGVAAVFRKFRRADSDFVGGFGPVLFDGDAIF